MVVACGVFLIYATGDFPNWGDPASPASSHLSPYFIENTLHDTSVPNIVTAILADYRGFDTMFETTVVFTAGLACFFLLRRRTKQPPDRLLYRCKATDIIIHIKNPDMAPKGDLFFERVDPLWTPRDIIIQTSCRILMPFIQIFALYVVAHGHHSPGGGFQGGVILGAAFILLTISYDLRSSADRFPERLLGRMSSGGIVIYAGVGAMALVFGGNFLDYSALAMILGVDPVSARSLGILFVEIGVAVTVMSTMILIYNNVASAGRYEQGL